MILFYITLYGCAALGLIGVIAFAITGFVHVGNLVDEGLDARKRALRATGEEKNQPEKECSDAEPW